LQSILFKFALDYQHMYHVVGIDGQRILMDDPTELDRADMRAAKAGGHELKGLECWIDAGVPQLKLPLVTLVDYRGYRLVAISWLRNMGKLVIGSGPSATPCYLPDNTCPTMNYDTANGAHRADALVGRAARHLNLRRHYIGFNAMPNNATSTATQSWTGFDVECHASRCSADEFFMLDFHRTLPPQALLTDDDRANRHFFVHMLRPELVRRFKAPLCSDVYLDGLAATYRRLRFDVDPSVQARAGDYSEMNQDVLEATLHLREVVVRQFAAELVGIFARGDPLELRGFRLVQELHRRGINCRLIGVVMSAVRAREREQLAELSARADKEACRRATKRALTALFIEAFARQVKRRVRTVLRGEMRRVKRPLEHPYRSVVMRVLNSVFSAQPRNKKKNVDEDYGEYFEPVAQDVYIVSLLRDMQRDFSLELEWPMPKTANDSAPTTRRQRAVGRHPRRRRSGSDTQMPSPRQPTAIAAASTSGTASAVSLSSSAMLRAANALGGGGGASEPSSSSSSPSAPPSPPPSAPAKYQPSASARPRRVKVPGLGTFPPLRARQADGKKEPLYRFQRVTPLRHFLEHEPEGFFLLFTRSIALAGIDLAPQVLDEMRSEVNTSVKARPTIGFTDIVSILERVKFPMALAIAKGDNEYLQGLICRSGKARTRCIANAIEHFEAALDHAPTNRKLLLYCAYACYEAYSEGAAAAAVAGSSAAASSSSPSSLSEREEDAQRRKLVFRQSEYYFRLAVRQCVEDYDHVLSTNDAITADELAADQAHKAIGDLSFALYGAANLMRCSGKLDNALFFLIKAMQVEEEWSHAAKLFMTYHTVLRDAAIANAQYKPLFHEFDAVHNRLRTKLPFDSKPSSSVVTRRWRVIYLGLVSGWNLNDTARARRQLSHFF
jgi:tetratricopeptide (TPR) repeat protein